MSVQAPGFVSKIIKEHTGMISIKTTRTQTRYTKMSKCSIKGEAKPSKIQVINPQ